ncbi:GerAB/ArcD/ProY family transporter [Effusibacillus consociatus]|uniref:Endospore germination permease n=1 Tax=Effusibacillus consociatus TaxID=1117041 RepID=A0ABV9Q8N8_9BACL
MHRKCVYYHFFAVLTSLASREFGEVVITSVLQRTPLEVTVIVMLLLAAISTRNEITTFAYIHMFYLPFLLAPGILIVVLSLKNATMINLLPILGNEPKGMRMGILTVSALFQGSFILTIVIPAMRHPEKAMKASLWGMLIAGGLYLAAVVATVAVFGAEETKLLLWPTLELAKTTSLPGNIMERLDAAFLAVWVTAVFTTLLSSYYLTVHAISELFRLRDHKMLSFFIFTFVFVIAMLLQNVLQTYQIIKSVGRTGLWITIAYPSLLLITATIRKKRGDRRGAGQLGETG